MASVEGASKVSLRSKAARLKEHERIVVQKINANTYFVSSTGCAGCRDTVSSILFFGHLRKGIH